MEDQKGFQFEKLSCPRCKSKKMIRFAWESGLKQMEVSSKGTSTKFTYEIGDSGIVSL